MSENCEAVVLLHGLLNKPFVVGWLAGELKKAGYLVHNWGYPSRDRLIQEHAVELAGFVKSLEGKGRIHFVGYSLGAIIIRYFLSHQRVPNAGRFVMIGPPNHGSEVAQRLYRYRWFRWLYKDKSIEQLFANQTEFFKECGIPQAEFGIIAGGRGTRQGYLSDVPGDDDGTVSVDSARLEGSKDFIVLKHPHTNLIFSPETAEQTIHFLKEGRFKRSPFETK